MARYRSVDNARKDAYSDSPVKGQNQRDDQALTPAEKQEFILKCLSQSNVPLTVEDLAVATCYTTRNIRSILKALVAQKKARRAPDRLVLTRKWNSWLRYMKILQWEAVD